MNSFFKAFTYAFTGIKLSFSQRNMRVMAACALLTIIAGFVLQINSTDWCIILGCIGMVLALETMNTAIEHFVDMVEPNYNPKAGAVKDLSAGAVFLFSLIAAGIGLIVFSKYIILLF